MAATVRATVRQIGHLELGRHHELAEFLRSRRSRVAPEAVGLERGSRRRTPGLRRTEVAALTALHVEKRTIIQATRASRTSTDTSRLGE